MEDKATRKAAVDDAMKDVRAQVQSCKDAIKELKEERKNQIKMVNEKHKESIKFLDTAQDRLNKTLKKLKKFQKNPEVGLDDIVLLKKKKNTSSALKKAAKLERKNSAKELKESEKAAKLERKNSEKELKQLIKLERKNSVKEMKEALKREEMEAKKASDLLKGKSSIEFVPGSRTALLVSTNDTKKRSAIATMRSFLINKLGFEENSIMTLSNMSKDANKMKILERLDELIEYANEKDCKEIIFFYSGDGIVVKNVKEQEYEDAIIPCDYKEKGIINSMTFNSRMEKISKDVKVTVLFDCCHNENFLEAAYEYCGGNDVLVKNNEPRNYVSDIKLFSLRNIEPEFKTRGVASNNCSHILARTFIEHYNECVEDNCSDVTVFSMLHDIRDYMVFNEIELVPVLYSPSEIKNESVLLHIE